MDFHLSGAERLLDEVRRCLGDRIKILVGGYPFVRDPDLAQKMGADAWAARGDEAVTLAGKLVGQSPDRSLS
jgi:methanogenic corrinoid protein MtbC1